MTTNLKQSLQQWRAAGKLSLETELLLAAACVDYAERLPQWAQLLSRQQPCWETVLSKAQSHCLRPLLWRFLGAIGAPCVPAHITRQLRLFAQQNALQNLGMTGELAGILDAFARQGVAALPFKGPTLAVLAHGDLALREFADLDILLTPPNLSSASKQMEARGYRPEFDLATVLTKGFLKVTNVLAFLHPTKNISVELHWQIAPPMFPFPLSQHRLWQDRQPVAPAKQPMTTLSTETLLVYLCAHGAKHWWECLAWLADVAWLIHRHPELDWEQAIESAYAAKCERQFWMGLLLASELLNVALPADVARRMHSAKAAQRLAIRVCRWLLTAEGTRPGMWQRCLFYSGLWAGVSPKVSFARKMLFSTTVADWRFLPLPGALSFLYLFIRPVRLLKDKLS